MEARKHKLAELAKHELTKAKFVQMSARHDDKRTELMAKGKELAALQAKLEELKVMHDDKHQRYETATAELERHRQLLTDKDVHHARLSESHSERLESVEVAHANKLEAVEKGHALSREELDQHYANLVSETNRSHESALAVLAAEHEVQLLDKVCAVKGCV